MPFGASLHFKLDEVGQIIQWIPLPKSSCHLGELDKEADIVFSSPTNVRQTRDQGMQHLHCSVLCTAPATLSKPGAQPPLLTVHLCGFSPVCLLMWTTSIYWALNGFCSREQSSHRHTNSFFSPCIWSLFICCLGRREITALQKCNIVISLTVTSHWNSTRGSGVNQDPAVLKE